VPAHASVRGHLAAATPLLAITLLGAVLRLWDFGRVTANPYYDAAVRSMGLSWHNFFFGAFEPGAQVSVDKTPVDLWLQVASVKLFGFSSAALRVPEVAAGILAIPLLYDLVRRLFGRRAGLGAAAALAVLPTAILTAHTDTMDSLMMLFDVLAAWLVVVGAQSRKAWPLVAAGAVLGVAFNVKLFEALIVVPALALLVLLAIDLPARRRALAFAGSLAAFVAVGLSWIVAASLTPLSGRPWPIGSTNGSIWNVVFGFNGIDRLRTPATPAALALDPPGALRFFRASGHGYATTVGTMLLAALVLGVAAVLAAAARRRRGARFDRIQRAGAVFFGSWLILGVGLLSHMQRLQPRYLEAATPAIAAAVGAGLAGLVAAAITRGRLGSA
jgi:4-amino-4-deoxy-L-arabinose transferase-like glycosyltransferase